MAKTFKKEFIGNGLAAHVLKRDLYKKAVYYIIRYRRNGYEIQVGATTLEEAKEKFLEAKGGFYLFIYLFIYLRALK